MNPVYILEAFPPYFEGLNTGIVLHRLRISIAGVRCMILKKMNRYSGNSTRNHVSCSFMFSRILRSYHRGLQSREG
jgi:hypothetical protein